jgi:hypothetical protein
MPAQNETHPHALTEPAAFTRAVSQLRTARLRPEVYVEEMPAPQRIAPFAAALSADVTVDGEEIGSGRLVLLHDPAGNDAWDGTFRCVSYVRAELDPEQVTATRSMPTARCTAPPPARSRPSPRRASAG